MKANAWQQVTDQRGEPEPKYRANGLKSGAEYKFRVRGKNKTGWSAWSGISDVFKTNVVLYTSSVKNIDYNPLMDWSSGDAANLVAYEVQVFSIPEEMMGMKRFLMGIRTLMIWHLG